MAVQKLVTAQRLCPCLMLSIGATSKAWLAKSEYVLFATEGYFGAFVCQAKETWLLFEMSDKANTCRYVEHKFGSVNLNCQKLRV